MTAISYTAKRGIDIHYRIVGAAASDPGPDQPASATRHGPGCGQPGDDFGARACACQLRQYAEVYGRVGRPPGPDTSAEMAAEDTKAPRQRARAAALHWREVVDGWRASPRNTRWRPGEPAVAWCSRTPSPWADPLTAAAFRDVVDGPRVRAPMTVMMRPQAP